jgi:hypothetical protein
MRRVAIASLILWLAAAAPALAQCNLRPGQEVVLYSTTDDPSVLIWDSRLRLRDYSAATFDEAQALLPHAILVAPGTHASVVTCVPKFVSSQIFTVPDDAVGVTILTGPRRGLTRWVLGSDVRQLHPVAPHP